MKQLIIELLHNYTRHLDVYATSVNQEIVLSDLSANELIDLFGVNSNNEILIDGYKFKIIRR